jgi:hypothetical protein
MVIVGDGETGEIRGRGILVVCRLCRKVELLSSLNWLVLLACETIQNAPKCQKRKKRGAKRRRLKVFKDADAPSFALHIRQTIVSYRCLLRHEWYILLYLYTKPCLN